MVERVTLWDVGAERQCELRGPDAVRFADYLEPRAWRTCRSAAAGSRRLR